MSRLAILLLASISAPLTAAADTPAAEAKHHVARATAFHQEGQFDQALLELKTAYALDPRPPLLFAMGQLHVRLGECSQAIAYYQRFLATRPARDPAALATEAIETCRTAPPPADPVPAPAPTLVAPPEPAPAPVTLTPPPPADTQVAVHAMPRAKPAWYENHVADALVVSGVVSGAAALFVLRSAHADRDAADTGLAYGAYEDQIAAARTKQTISIVLGVSGAALIAAGGVHFWLSNRGARDHGVQIAPARGGGTVSWSGRF